MRTGRPVELVMGSAQLGLVYGAANRTGKPTREAAIRLVRRAADSGVAAFDTARASGDAAERLGEALKGRKVTTITKLAPLSELPADASVAAVEAAVDASVEQSRAALGRDQLDCLLLHRASYTTLFRSAIWDRLKQHVAKGRIKSLGVSVQSPAETHRALADSAVAHIQLPFNLLDWRWREASVIAVLRSRPDVTVHARSVLLQGVLTAADAHIWPAIPGLDAPWVIGWLRGAAATFDRENVADFAFAFARGQDWIDGIVIGQETEDQLTANLKLAARPPLSREDCLKVEQSAPHVPERLLDPAQWKPQ